MKDKDIKKKIEDLIDHYTPYRPITDSPEAQEVRKVLSKLLEDIKWNYMEATVNK